MTDRLQRPLFLLVGLAVVLLVGWLTYEQLSAHRPDILPTDAGLVAETGAEVTDLGADDAGALLALDDDDAGGELSTTSDLAAALPQGAPRYVHLGVVLVQFAGAEGAPPTARPKREATTIAQRLAEEAKTNFRHAVLSADPGSAEDVGRIPRGVLDPRTEMAVFSLPPGTVSDVLETPRGYWIVKRID